VHGGLSYALRIERESGAGPINYAVTARRLHELWKDHRHPALREVFDHRNYHALGLEPTDYRCAMRAGSQSNPLDPDACVESLDWWFACDDDALARRVHTGLIRADLRLSLYAIHVREDDLDEYPLLDGMCRQLLYRSAFAQRAGSVRLPDTFESWTSRAVTDLHRQVTGLRIAV
jgi:hypothetical protein